MHVEGRRTCAAIHFDSAADAGGIPPNDASVGDLDGDGEYEIVLHRRAGAATTRRPA